MKKILSIAAATLMLSTAADARIDFYQGWEMSDVSFSTDKTFDKTQRGIGFGGRLYTEINPQLDIGGELGFSHVETDSSIGGNVLHLQFILKYHFTSNFEVFGGVGGAMRGAYEKDINATTRANDDSIYTGGLWSLGAAWETDGGWRIDASYHSISFSGVVNGTSQTIDTGIVGVHLGKSFDIN